MAIQDKYNPELESLIEQAVQKIRGVKENDICRYLPGPGGFKMHHFTMQKKKTEEPEELYRLIHRCIIDLDQPIEVSPKPRAARGSRKRREQPSISKQDLEVLINIVRQSGNKDLVKKLTPKKDLKTIKKELILSIREGRIDQELWQCYMEAVATQSNVVPSAFAHSLL